MVKFLVNYQKLRTSIPVPALQVTNNENCTYVDYTHRSKNCHYCFVCFGCENCNYTRLSVGKYLTDCFTCAFCEMCYECVECINCYNSTHLQDSTNCRDSHFLIQCVNCENCFSCVSLTHKKYCIYNKQYKKEVYFEKLKKLKKLNSTDVLEKLALFQKNIPTPQSFQRGNENCPCGDYLTNSKNIYWGFNTYWTENSGYFYYGGMARNCWDMTQSGGGASTTSSVEDLIKTGNYGELCYEMVGGGGNYNCTHLELCVNCTNCFYGSRLRNCSDCFGCVGLISKKYCILNNQLSKSDYEKAVVEIKKKLGWSIPGINSS